MSMIWHFKKICLHLKNKEFNLGTRAIPKEYPPETKYTEVPIER